jgi:xylulokinase
MSSLVLGTSGVLFTAMDSYHSDDQARLHVFCHAVPGAWHAMGVMLSAADSLRWLRDEVLDGALYEDILAEADAWAPTSEGLTFLPYLVGERTPHADPEARAAFCGLSARHDRGALVRAVLEGVAYGLRDSMELLHALGLKVDRARVSGGGTKSDLWLRILASVLNIPLEVTEVEEGAAYGAAMLGGIAGGAFENTEDAVAACVRVRRTVDPESGWRDDYAAGYRTFRDLYPALRRVQSEGVTR